MQSRIVIGSPILNVQEMIVRVFGAFALLWLLGCALPLAAQSVSATGPADDPTRQTEASWVDDRWSKTDVGQFLSATIETPRKRTAKAIAIKLGESNQATICFDTDLLRYSAGWIGGFLRISGQRYGLMGALSPEGEIQFATAVPGWARNSSFEDPRSPKLGALPPEWAKYKGLYRRGNRVVLAYTVGTANVLESPWFEEKASLAIFTRSLELRGPDEPRLLRVVDAPDAEASIEKVDGVPIGKLKTADGFVAAAVIGQGFELIAGQGALNVRTRSGLATAKILICKMTGNSLQAFASAAKAASIESLVSLVKTPGLGRWGAPLVTKGSVDRSQSAFAIDTITMPYENPWNALMFASGHDFFSNGDAAVATIHGDVWLVRGLDATLDKITWHRFATGLYQPLGVKIINDKLHVLERDQITILHDRNGDGEADDYENFNNDCIGAGGGHSYTTSLETDLHGTFYFAKCAENTPHGGTVLKVPRDGSSIEVVATGFRNPNGLGIGPGDLLTVADQQGDWVPETRLDLIRPGGFYGFTPMHKRAQVPTTYNAPLCWIPRHIDNSAGGQVWVPENTWGPFAGQMLHLSYGRCTMMLVLRDQSTNPPAQGAVIPLPGRFASGVCRGRFHPRDGHLYLTGLRGWQTAAVRDGCFQRVRYQKPLPIPTEYSVRSNQFTVTFSEPLDRALAEDLESYSAEMWNYKWTSNYGSPDFSPARPNEQGRDPVKITAAHLSPDGKTITLTLSSIREVMQFALTYNLETAQGNPVQNTLYATINHLR